MHTRSKLILTGLTAAFLLMLTVSTASAQRLSVNIDRGFLIIWRQLAFKDNIFRAVQCECPVTLEGSFHSATIHKVRDALIGYITKAFSKQRGNGCNVGSSTLLSETLPWHVRYRGFTGILPNITGIEVGLINVSIRIAASSGIECLLRTTVANPGVDIINVTPEAGGIGKVTTATPNPRALIPCGGINGFFEASGNVYRLNTTRQDILVTLI